ITLAVERTADTPSAALSACTASTNAVVAAVREHISGSSGVQTSDLSVHPSYDRHGDRPDGYAARSTLTIRTGNLDGAGSIATDALEAADDAGQIHGLSLIVDDTRAASDEARAAAFTDAKRKAEHYAA